MNGVPQESEAAMPAESLALRPDALPAPPGEAIDPAIIEQVVVGGDLARLTPAQRVEYYRRVCASLNLNPLTRPFEYLRLNDRLTLYAKREATDQLRRLHRVSVEIVSREQQDDIYVVTARATTPDGRADEATGAVSLAGLSGANLANSLMKAECVPLESEILTREGFKRHGDLLIGEEVLAYDLAADRTVWTPLQAISVFGSAPLVRLASPGGLFDIRCTPNHSWAIMGEAYAPSRPGTHPRGPRGPYANRRPLRRLVETQHLKGGYRLVLAAPEMATASSLLSPPEAALLGWAVTDGTVQRRGRFVRLGVCQSKQEHVDHIREVFQSVAPGCRELVSPARRRTFPTGRTYFTKPQHWWYAPSGVSRPLLQRAGFGGREDLPRIVARLSPAARRAMLEAFMRAEGDKRQVFANGDRHVLDAFQMLCALEGIATGAERPHAGIVVQRLKLARHAATAFLHVSPAEPGPVWCPTTAYGTWVMRQNGRVLITGNTKAKRRVTLSICGLGWLDESEVDSVPVARPVRVSEGGGIEDAAYLQKLRRRFGQVGAEATALGVPWAPLPEDADEATIVRLGRALRAEVERAREARRPRRPIL